MTDNGDDIPGIGQYDDFHTIDWQRDIAKDRMRHRYILKKRQNSLWDLIKVCFNFFLKINKTKIKSKLKNYREHMMHGLDGSVYY